MPTNNNYREEAQYAVMRKTLEKRARLEKRIKELEDALIEVWCICRQRAPKCAKLLTEVKYVIGIALGRDGNNANK